MCILHTLQDIRTLRFAHKQETHGRRGMHDRLQVRKRSYSVYMCTYMYIHDSTFLYSYVLIMYMYVHVLYMWMWLSCVQIVAFPLSYGKNPFAYSFKETYSNNGWKVYNPMKELRRLVRVCIMCYCRVGGMYHVHVYTCSM